MSSNGGYTALPTNNDVGGAQDDDDGCASPHLMAATHGDNDDDDDDDVLGGSRRARTGPRAHNDGSDAAVVVHHGQPVHLPHEAGDDGYDDDLHHVRPPDAVPARWQPWLRSGLLIPTFLVGTCAWLFACALHLDGFGASSWALSWVPFWLMWSLMTAWLGVRIGVCQAWAQPMPLDAHWDQRRTQVEAGIVWGCVGLTAAMVQANASGAHVPWGLVWLPFTSVCGWATFTAARNTVRPPPEARVADRAATGALAVVCFMVWLQTFLASLHQDGYMGGSWRATFTPWWMLMCAPVWMPCVIIVVLRFVVGIPWRRLWDYSRDDHAEGILFCFIGVVALLITLPLTISSTMATSILDKGDDVGYWSVAVVPTILVGLCGASYSVYKFRSDHLGLPRMVEMV